MADVLVTGLVADAVQKRTVPAAWLSELAGPPWQPWLSLRDSLTWLTHCAALSRGSLTVWLTTAWLNTAWLSHSVVRVDLRPCRLRRSLTTWLSHSVAETALLTDRVTHDGRVSQSWLTDLPVSRG